VGAVHALAYPIGSHFHVPHGLSNSLVLPAVLRFNNGDAQARSLYAQMAPIIFPTLAKGGEPDGEMLAAGFEQLAADLGIQTRLSQVGITEADVGLLVTEGMKQERLLPNNMRKVTASDAEGVYRSVL
jgi:alcohol dehydrogenase